MAQLINVNLDLLIVYARDFNFVADIYRQFSCNGECNNDSDVCVHNFAWQCPFCGVLLISIGENMQDEIESSGNCLTCQNIQEPEYDDFERFPTYP